MTGVARASGPGTSRGDVLVAAGFLVASALEALLGGTGGNRLVYLAAAVVATVPLAWRRSRPALALVLSSLPFGPGLLLATRPDELLVPFAALLLAAYSAGLHAERRELLVGLGSVLLLIAASIVVAGEGPDDSAYAVLVIAFPVVPARLLRRRLAEVARLTERAIRAEHDAEAAAGAAAAEERNRLAREMHDIIGHGVSLMVVHAAAAESHLGDPDVARRSLHAIQESGRQAVSDLARLLGLLRDEHAEIGLAPQPGLVDVERLVTAARAGGDEVALRIDGDLHRVPATAGLTAYRVVQEGLTNARRHAPGATVEVDVTITGRVVSVSVVNGPAGGGSPIQPVGTGTGIAGLRERVGLFKGSLRAEPCRGGFVLAATIPFEPVGA